MPITPPPDVVTRIEAGEIILQDRRDIGVEHGRAGALEFEHLRQNLVRQRDVHLGDFLCQDFAGALLVSRVHERIDVDHGHGLHPALANNPRGAPHVVLVELRHYLTVGADALAHDQHVTARDDQLGRVPIELERRDALGPPAAQHVAEALGGD